MLPLEPENILGCFAFSEKFFGEKTVSSPQITFLKMQWEIHFLEHHFLGQNSQTLGSARTIEHMKYINTRICGFSVLGTSQGPGSNPKAVF